MARRRVNPHGDPFESIANCIAFSPHDWSAHPRMAWIYGIAIGWDAESAAELADKFGWGADTSRRLKRLRADYVRRTQPKPRRKRNAR